MKNEKRNVFRFPFFYENEKRIKVSKIQRKNLLNMKMVVSYLNFVFFIKVKAKSKYKILNFVFQFIKKTKWHFGYTDFDSILLVQSLFSGTAESLCKFLCWGKSLLDFWVMWSRLLFLQHKKGTINDFTNSSCKDFSNFSMVSKHQQMKKKMKNTSSKLSSMFIW